MLSDLSYSNLSFDIPVFPEIPDVLPPEEDALNFNVLLDITRDFGFNRSTHIWPCEDEPSPLSETELEDLLASIVHTPPSEESSPSSPPSVSVDQETHLQRPASAFPVPDMNASILIDPVTLPKNDDQVPTETGVPTTPKLQGWSPPNGSHFLDLDESMMVFQSAKDVWFPPWLAALFIPSDTQPVVTTNQPLPTTSENGETEPQTAKTQPKPPPVSATYQTADDRKENVPPVPLLVKPSSRATREAARSQLTQKPNSTQTVTTHRAKSSKARSRTRLPSAPPTSATSYAKAPRGGVPPHVARSVTKANILRVEQERKVIQDAFSSTTKGEGRKPSVLRGSTTGQRGTSKTVSSSGSAKKSSNASESDDKEERAIKRART